MTTVYRKSALQKATVQQLYSMYRAARERIAKTNKEGAQLEIMHFGASVLPT